MSLPLLYVLLLLITWSGLVERIIILLNGYRQTCALSALASFGRGTVHLVMSVQANFPALPQESKKILCQANDGCL